MPLNMAPEVFHNHDGFGAKQVRPATSEMPLSGGMMGPHSGQSPSPPLSPLDQSGQQRDSVADGEISVLDPRRFTPTLHASLVSEILSLRRDLDSKIDFIEGLESSLQSARQDNDLVAEKLSKSTKENRLVTLELESLEKGTLSALEDIAKERDTAKASAHDLKVKFELLETRFRKEEQSSARSNELWEKDKDAWSREKNSLERRAHISESRLKMLLHELTAHPDVTQKSHEDSVDHVQEDTIGGRDLPTCNESDTNSIRSLPRPDSVARVRRHRRNRSSASIHRPYRFSTLSTAGSDGQPRLNGMSLADELNFDEEEEDIDELMDEDDDVAELEMRTRRVLESRQSQHQDEKAKRVLGISPTPWEPPPPTNIASHSYAGDTAVETVAVATEPLPIINGTTPTQIRQTAPPLKPLYVDSAIQYSPPPSPKAVSHRRAPSVTTNSRSHSRHMSGAGADALVDTKSQFVAQLVSAYETIGTPVRKMVSSSSQTIDEPPSPPATPKSQNAVSPPLAVDEPERPITISVSTQTDMPALTSPVAVSKSEMIAVSSSSHPFKGPAPIMIPTIEIHPPLSAPPSPKQAVLPPRTKNAESQVNWGSLTSTISVSVQTEEIRIDARPVKLPPHLLPSAILGGAVSGERRESAKVQISNELSHPNKLEGAQYKAPIPYDLDFPTEPTLSSAAQGLTEVRYPGNNDNGPLAQDTQAVRNIRRPFRSSSLFAGFEGNSSDEDEEPELQIKKKLRTREKDREREREREREIEKEKDKNNDVPQASARHSAPKLSSRGSRHTRPFANPPTPVPEEKVAITSIGRVPENERIASPTGSGSTASSPATRTSLERQSKVAKPVRYSGSKHSNFWRSALIQSGTAAHMRQHTRSPSNGSAGSSSLGTTHNAVPPFPVPTRSSSRRIPLSKSEGSQSPTPRPGGSGGGSGFFAHRRSNHGSQHSRNDSLRKVRSAAVIARTGPQNEVSRQRSRSPPPHPPSHPTAAYLNQIPPLPRDSITSPGFRLPPSHHSRKSHASSNASNAGSASVDPNLQQASVVDAIAATMVGEWMWKYVRRRKSFGVGESPQELAKTTDDGPVSVSGGGARHKRWVWLSPYERTVMWSAKQPTSEAALLGKSGRKLNIQSVLDVKDDALLPKNSGATTIFNRSILILTPARALKFTTVSKERHYLWLTALSFLAHSSQDPPPAVPALPPVPRPEHDARPRPQIATLRRAPIRDSVRLAKDRTRADHQSRGSGGAAGDTFADQPYEASILRGQPDDLAGDAASPPNVPRFAHGRKRSNTGPRLPRSSLANYRSFSHNQMPLSANPPHVFSDYPQQDYPPYLQHQNQNPSQHQPSQPPQHPQQHQQQYPPSANQQLYHYGGASSSRASSSLHNGNSGAAGSSRRTSVASSSLFSPAGNGHNFFEAIGTVRMEAFVEPRISEDMAQALPGMNNRPGMIGRRCGPNVVGGASTGDQFSSGGMVYDDGFDGLNPFGGF